VSTAFSERIVLLELNAWRKERRREAKKSIISALGVKGNCLPEKSIGDSRIRRNKPPPLHERILARTDFCIETTVDSTVEPRMGTTQRSPYHQLVPGDSLHRLQVKILYVSIEVSCTRFQTHTKAVRKILVHIVEVVPSFERLHTEIIPKSRKHRRRPSPRPQDSRHICVSNHQGKGLLAVMNSDSIRYTPHMR